MGKSKKSETSVEGGATIAQLPTNQDHTQDRSQRFQSQLLKGDAESRQVFATVSAPFTVVYRDGIPVAARLAPGVTAIFPEDECFGGKHSHRVAFFANE
jgi:hypothetical protein